MASGTGILVKSADTMFLSRTSRKMAIWLEVMKKVYELFIEYFASVASNIGFSDDIPDNYNTGHGSQCILMKCENRPSICKIRNNVNTEDNFEFCLVTISQVQKIIEHIDPKTAQGWDNILTKLLRIGSRPLAQTLTGPVNCAFEKATYSDRLNWLRFHLSLKRMIT